MLLHREATVLSGVQLGGTDDMISQTDRSKSA